MNDLTSRELWDEELDAVRFEADPEVDALLVGGVDLHVHPAPSPFPRRISVLDAAKDAGSAGFRAILVKSHHLSMQTEVLALKMEGMDDTGVQVYAGAPTNPTVGGLNPAFVEVVLSLGGKMVWMPTLSSPAHVAHHAAGGGFPTETRPLRDPEALSILDDNGRVKAEVREILGLIHEFDAILNCGHLPAAEIDVLMPAAVEAGIQRIVVSHPDFIIDAAPGQVEEWVRQGATIEFCLGMLVGRNTDVPPIERMRRFYEVSGPAHSILSSDQGQKGNQLPITGYKKMVRVLLDAKWPEKDITALVGDNAWQLLQN